jgi:signal peptidase I
MANPEPLPREAVVVRSRARQKSTVREYAEALGVALLLALVIRTFVVQAFKIPSGSMLPTLQIGDHILVNKFVYGPRLEIPLTQLSLGQLPGLRAPRPGDVVVFVWPKDRSKDFIKRVVAVEGQTVELRQKQLYVDGKPWDDPHATYGKGRSGPSESFGPVTVPPGNVFVMGDNRDQSYDSRFWGPVPIADIKGQALIIYWSWDGPDRWVRWERIGRLVY